MHLKQTSIVVAIGWVAASVNVWAQQPSTTPQPRLRPEGPAPQGASAVEPAPVSPAAEPAPRGGGPCGQPASFCQEPQTANAHDSGGTRFAVADDFRPAADGVVTSVCWWGTYDDLVLPADAFVVTYYDDNAGFPGTILDAFSQTNGSLTVTEPVATPRRIGRLPEYEYSATHAAVPVAAGQCYWIEITNANDGSRNWFWSFAVQPGPAVNQRAVQDGEPLDGYDPGDLIAADAAFCLDIALDVAGSCVPVACCLPGGSCGVCVELNPQDCAAAAGAVGTGPCAPFACATVACGACCFDFGTCAEMTAADCQSFGGIYQGDSVSCDSSPCPAGPAPCCLSIGFCTILPQPDCLTLGGTPRPAAMTCADAACNDDCAMAELVWTDTIVVADTRPATSAPTDPVFSCHWTAPPPAPGENTLWYKFVATTPQILIDLCATGPDAGDADSTVALYQAAPGDACNTLVELACGEDAPHSGSLLSRIDYDGLIVNTTYYIQVANAGNPAGFDAGVFTLDLTSGCIPATACCRGDANGDGRMDGRDIQAFLAALVTQPACGSVALCRQDVNADLTVDGSDLVPFVDALLGGRACAADDCADALPITGVVTPFSTIGTATDGPALPATCDEGFGLSFEHDAWFCYTAPCTATITVTTCGAVNYDVRLAAYVGCGCPASNADLLACSDDAAGCSDFGASLSFDVTTGQTYLIRVGGFGQSTGDGLLIIDCNIAGDVNCDLIVDETDIAAFVLALADPAGYALAHPDCHIGTADLNGDGAPDGADIQVFVDILLSGG